MKTSKSVVYPMDEILDFASQALRPSTWESAGPYRSLQQALASLPV